MRPSKHHREINQTDIAAGDMTEKQVQTLLEADETAEAQQEAEAVDDREVAAEEVGRGSKSKRKLAAQKTRKSAAAFVRIGLQLEQTQYV